MTRRARQDAGAGRLVAAVAGAVALVSLAAPLLWGGREAGAWAFPGRLPSGPALGRGVLLAAALWCALAGWEALARRMRPRAVRVAGVALLAAGLAVVLRFVLPPTYIGDWQWMLWIVEDGRPLGKWYGASLLYVLADRMLSPLAGLTPLASIRWTSALCGAGTALLWWGGVRVLGLPRLGPAWPALFVSAFGTVGVALGHVEVYAAVTLLFALCLFTAIRMVERASPGRVAAFALAAGMTFGAYVAMLLVVPIALALLAWGVWQQAGPGRRALVAVAAAVLFALPTVAERALGPEPIGEHLIEFWAEQSGRATAALPKAKAFQPDDVYWKALPHFMAPKYWFSGWHLADLGQAALLDDRLGLALVLALGPASVLTWWRRRRQGGTEWKEGVVPAPRPLVVPAVASLVFLAYGFALVNGRPYPWDWDLFAWVSLPVSLLAAGLLAASAPVEGLDRRAQGLIALVGLLAAVQGASFFLATPRTPGAFGPPAGALRLAVVPDRWEIADGRPVHLWLWLANTTSSPIHVRPEWIVYEFEAGSADTQVRQARRRRRVVGGRWVPAGGVACLHDFTWDPARLESRPRGGGDEVWGTFDGAESRGRSFRGRLVVTLPDQEKRGAGRLTSNPVILLP